MDIQKLLGVASAKIQSLVQSWSKPTVNHNPLINTVNTVKNVGSYMINPTNNPMFKIQLPEIPKLNIPNIPIKNPVGNFAVNSLVKPMAESIINTPSNFISGSNNINRGIQTRQLDPILTGIGQAGEAGLNLATMGGAGTLAKGVIKPTFKIALLEGLKTGGWIGGAYGGTNVLQSGDYSPQNIAKTVGWSALLGGGLGVTGGLLGGAVGKVKVALDRVNAKAKPGEIITMGDYARYKATGKFAPKPEIPGISNTPMKINYWQDKVKAVDKELGIDKLNSQEGFIKLNAKVGTKPSVPQAGLYDIEKTFNPNNAYLDRNIKTLNAHGISVKSPNDVITLYHGSGEGGITRKDMGTFNAGTFFATDKNAVKLFAGQKGKIYEVKVPVSDLGFVQSGTMAGSKGVSIQTFDPLIRGEDGIYHISGKIDNVESIIQQKQNQLKELGHELTDMEQYGDPNNFPNYQKFQDDYSSLKNEIDKLQSRVAQPTISEVKPPVQGGSGGMTLEQQAIKKYGITNTPTNSLYITTDGRYLGNKGLEGGAEHMTYQEQLIGKNFVKDGVGRYELAKQSGMLEIVDTGKGGELNVRLYTNPTTQQITKLKEIIPNRKEVFIDDYRGLNPKTDNPVGYTKDNVSQFFSSLSQPVGGVKPPVQGGMGGVNTKGQPTNTGVRMKEELALKTTPKVQTVLPKSNISGQPLKTTLSQKPTPEEVAKTLPIRVDNFIQKTLGYTTQEPTGGSRGASGYTKTLRKGQEFVSRKIETAMTSENKLVRTAATTLQNFFRGAGMSPERATASMELRGGIGTANERAFNVMDSLYKTIGKNKGSLERINAVLDPELAKTKVGYNQLTTTEKQVYKIIREGLDIVHDTSYANGHISEATYLANKGKYTPRLYDVMELPPEINKFVTQGKKMVNDMYKQRKTIDEWKTDNSLNDPVYGLGKRLAQVETNTAIKKYTDFLSSNSRFVSDVERPGFAKLSDSPAYGALKGKYVMNSAAEDLKGFFFSNQAMQNLYDVFRAYDRMGIRQLQKKLLTVFNPTTNVGNIVSDQVFGFVTGVDPLTLNKNLLELRTNPSKYKQIADYLMKKGIVGTDITRTDFVNKLGQMNDLALGKNQSKFKIATDKVQSFYGGTDDVYKASAFKSLLDKGFSVEEATRKVADGFQNYANVGKFYDVWAKTPVVGSAFIKFQGDLLRIIKNGAVNNPLGLIGFLGTLWSVARLSSKLSGESDADRQTRENRFAAPMIPGLNIPLTWQTPWGEINAARYISPFYANNETTNLAKMFPFMPNIQTNKDVASNIAMNANDPLLSTPVQLLVNRDFRGKPISDPNENKYQPSTLTGTEKLINQVKFAGRAYMPPPVNSAIDVNSAIQGKPNMYGTPQTVPQAVARLAGIKVSNMNPTEVQKIRDSDAQFQQYANESIDKQISSVTKQLLNGEITQDQADSRINNLESQKKSEDLGGGITFIKGSDSTPITSDYKGKVVKVGNQFAYLDSHGTQQKTDTEREAQIGVEKINFQKSTDNFKDLGDVVLRKSKDGTVKVTPKDDYSIQLYEAKMTNAKNNDNSKDWYTSANALLNLYQKQLTDPSVDELDKVTLQNKLISLVKSINKGIGKKIKVPKLKASKIDLSKFQLKNYTTNKAPSMPIQNVKFTNPMANGSTRVALPNFRVKFNL
jgi:hypothetical protein